MASTEPSIVFTDEGRSEDREGILRRLMEYNLSHGPQPNSKMRGLLLRSEAGEVIGGL